MIDEKTLKSTSIPSISFCFPSMTTAPPHQMWNAIYHFRYFFLFLWEMCFLQRNCYPFFSPFHSSKTRGGERDCPLIRRRSKCEFITTNYACRKSGILRSNLYSCLLSSFQLWMSDWLTLTRRWLRIEVFSFSWFWEFEKIHIRNACLRYGAKKFIDFLPICHVFNSFFAIVSVFFLVGSLTTLHVYTRTPTLIGTSITQTGLTSAELSKLSFFFVCAENGNGPLDFFQRSISQKRQIALKLKVFLARCF